MKINQGGFQRFMSEKLFDKDEIRTVFVKMCTECMTERMTCEAPFPSEFIFVSVDVLTKVESINRGIIAALFGE